LHALLFNGLCSWHKAVAGADGVKAQDDGNAPAYNGVTSGPTKAHMLIGPKIRSCTAWIGPYRDQ